MNHDVVVTVATYKRPGLLQELLDSLEEEYSRTPFSVIVIDNDANGSGKAIADAASVPLVYAIEPKPGIAAARNAALDRVPSSATHIVFVDDDEVVSSGWLGHLLRVETQLNADIVCGPVDSLFPAGSPAWIERGGYIQRPDEEEGITARMPATNNTLVRTEFLRSAGDPRFDEAFSRTGGSDTAFFTPLLKQGARVAWSPSARVSERVPADRLTFRWVMRRYIRLDNVSGRLLLSTTSRPVLAAKGIGNIAYGVLRTAAALLVGKGLRLKDTCHITRGLGWLGAVSDRLVQEYSRPASSTTP
ncbi:MULTISPECIES: glycosyltransferase family 2 protein [unclassified Rathayibacter]|uniref:glycosyltransferase family 2 protein n=1 Tax=unclassified Rathayibacter TaxID=2609250 RepID=UPI00188C464C|nr:MULTISPECIES: glycosyltransferase family 2 protein [unclassified Rathayibacter]MBF4463521.1 glycosyltransferase [Rathayibacter sp. VKM Ac-2879]MBF4504757.1 glycosyltransferase [Rathayibacter sp. VKM Ac-2878]